MVHVMEEAYDLIRREAKALEALGFAVSLYT